jgi:uncharacterized protein involved in exopolysaccharide biosynthesis
MKTLEELKARRAAEVEKLKSGDADALASSGVSADPVYQSIRLRLNQADEDIASLGGQVAQHRAKVANLRQHLDEAPQVEADYAQLVRDYDTTKSQYTAFLASYEKQQLGERADDAGSVRFENVQPPTAPFGPASPRRLLLLVATLVAGFGIGGALSYLLHLLNPVVGSAQGLAELTGRTVLGLVSPAFPHLHAARRRVELLQFIGAGSVLVVVFAGVIALDILGVRVPYPGSG